jgi:hypothetical protein
MASSRTALQRLAAATRARRQQLGITQEVAAARCHLSVRFWRDLEASRPATVRLDVLERVIEGLDWSWAEVVAVISPEKESETPVAMRRLFDDAWRRASVRERDVVAAGLRVLAGERRTRG